MNKIIWILVSLASVSFGQAQSAEVRGRQSNAQVVDFIIALQENRVMTVAEAMPAEKYSFAPQGDGFKGVRTFAEELKHIAADNYLLGAGILGIRPPAETGEGRERFERGAHQVRNPRLSQEFFRVHASRGGRHGCRERSDFDAGDFALAGREGYASRRRDRGLHPYL